MVSKRSNLKFNKIHFPKHDNSIWVDLTKNFNEKVQLEKKNYKITKMEDKIYFLFRNLKEIGNYLFKQAEYENAKYLYNISLSIVPCDKISERSLNFSNRAQCSIFLGGKIQSLIDCTCALKLYIRHDKSWYRKIFVSKGLKDYVNCIQIILIVRSLSIKFVRKHVCIQSEFYGKNIVRLGNVTLKKKRNRKLNYVQKNPSLLFNKIKKKKAFIFILSLINIVQIACCFFFGYYFSGFNLIKSSDFTPYSNLELAMHFRYKFKKKKGFFLEFLRSFKYLMENLILFKLNYEIRTVNI